MKVSTCTHHKHEGKEGTQTIQEAKLRRSRWTATTRTNSNLKHKSNRYLFSILFGFCACNPDLWSGCVKSSGLSFCTHCWHCLYKTRNFELTLCHPIHSIHRGKCECWPLSIKCCKSLRFYSFTFIRTADILFLTILQSIVDCQIVTLQLCKTYTSIIWHVCKFTSRRGETLEL